MNLVHKNQNDALDKAMLILGEHFDSVRVICASDMGDGSHIVSRGSGCWFTQYGSVKTWLNQKESYENGYNAAKGQQDAYGD
jgi:hypothetical protein